MAVPSAAAIELSHRFQAPLAGIGSNSGASLEEVLAETSSALVERAKLLAESAGRASVVDEETAGKATLLAKMIREHIATINAQREEDKAPHLKAGRTIDAHYQGIAATLATYTKVGSREQLTGGPLFTVMGLIDGYRVEQEKKAEAERRRLEDEARKAREAAEAAAKAQEAATEPEQKIEAEIVQRKAAETAQQLAQQAAAVRAGPIDTGLGIKASSRTTYRGTIVDFDKALKWATKLDRDAVTAAVQAIVDRQVKAKNHAIPGVEVAPVTTTVIR